MMNQAPEIWFPYLGIQINHLSRVAVTVFGVELYWYGIFIVCGVLAGLIMALREAKRTGQDPDLYFDFLFVALVCALIGARLYYVIFSWDDYKDNLIKILAVREGGLAIYGGVIGGFLAGFVYARRKKVKFGLFADTGAPCFLIGQAIGRMGNFFNREAFGGYTDNLFAMRYLREQVYAASPAVLNRLVLAEGAEYIQVHPTFLYEALWNLAVLLFIVLYRKHKKFDGELALLYLLGYGLGRFWIESLRTDQLLLFHTAIPASQLLSALLVIGSLSIIAYFRKKRPKLSDEQIAEGYLE